MTNTTAAEKFENLVNHLINKYRTAYPTISDDDLVGLVRRALLELAK